MARFYTNENVPAQVVVELRRLGHDVVTSLDAGKANCVTNRSVSGTMHKDSEEYNRS